MVPILYHLTPIPLDVEVTITDGGGSLSRVGARQKVDICILNQHPVGLDTKLAR